MTCDFVASANPGVQKLQPYQPGKPVEELERELGITNIIKLASNENPLGPSARSQSAFRHVQQEIHRYPDGSGFRLKQVLAEKNTISPAMVTLGNGSNDVLELIARAWLGPEDEVIFSEYAFAVYPLVTLACSATPVSVPAVNFGHDLSAMLNAITAQTRIIFIANPNNPTGTWLTDESLRAFLERVPEHVLVVVDEAYVEYVDEPAYKSALGLLSLYPNLIVTRTFSKAYGLAGLRVGYAVSSESIADVLNRVRQPFNCNLPALAAAEAALHDEVHLQQSCEVNATGMTQLAAGLRRLELVSIPSVANFIAFDCGQDAMPVYQRLLQQGVIVRPLSGYGMPQHLRVTVGLADENQRFLEALENALRL